MMAQFAWPGRRRAHVQRCTFGLGLLAAGARRAGRPQGEADMIPASFEYAVARDIADAIQLLASSGGEGKVLAGGQSLIPLMKFRLAQPALLVDLNRVTGLAEIRENGDLRIGALVREADLDTNAIVKARYPILVDTTRVIADPLVRNMATVGGNLARARPRSCFAANPPTTRRSPRRQRRPRVNRSPGPICAVRPSTSWM